MEFGKGHGAVPGEDALSLRGKRCPVVELEIQLFARAKQAGRCQSAARGAQPRVEASRRARRRGHEPHGLPLAKRGRLARRLPPTAAPGTGRSSHKGKHADHDRLSLLLPLCSPFFLFILWRGC